MSTDEITGDPVQVWSLGGQLHIAHIHDVADDGDDVDRILLEDPLGLVSVAQAAAHALTAQLRRTPLAPAERTDLARWVGNLADQVEQLRQAVDTVRVS